MIQIRPERIRDVRTKTIGPSLPSGGDGSVVYWVNRDRRAHDNWALTYARSCGDVRVVYCLPERPTDASLRQHTFLLQCLDELAHDLASLHIPFDVLEGEPRDALLPYLERYRPSLLITDMDPLRESKRMVRDVAGSTTMPIHMVDAHNIVPVWSASDKEEFAAYTIRPKITRHLSSFLDDFPADNHPRSGAGQRQLESFLSRLETYVNRNDPTQVGQSNLSPYLHFGQLSAQRVALETLKHLGMQPNEITDIKSLASGFLEELIIRRELADNYTFYNDHYDSFDGLQPWAQRTLNDHRSDKRDHLYTLEEWEGAMTHDPLWNAAQNEMLRTGKMHGYMRMYWAKKILEWSASPDEAIATAITLNDRYSIDGQDPNGYVGIAWSIGGLHDRAWTERPVYGKIRYMNDAGCRRKFDVTTYIARHDKLF